jgi:small-conductance mechanosensitive channel
MPQYLARYLELVFSPGFLSLFIKRALDIAWILLVGLIAMRLIDSALRRLPSIVSHGPSTGARHVGQRTETLRGIVRSFSKVVLTVVVLLTVSQDLGFNVVPLLATAGVAGLAIAFAAQSLVKDFISGFFILLEDQYAVGDVVRIADRDGIVERMTLRATTLRNAEGQAHIIPNGNIQTVTVLAREWARAVVDITVSHQESLERVRAALSRAGARLVTDLKGGIVEEPNFLGIESLADGGVTLRLSVQTEPLKQSKVKREWLLRIKEEFDRDGIVLADKKA